MKDYIKSVLTFICAGKSCEKSLSQSNLTLLPYVGDQTCKCCQLAPDPATDEAGPTCLARRAVYRPAESCVPTLQLRDATLTASQSGSLRRTLTRHPCQVSAVTATQCVGGQCVVLMSRSGLSSTT